MMTSVAGPPPGSLLWRLQRALGPILGGLILDMTDLATFGPVGLYAGFFLGAGIGWWISSFYNFPNASRALCALFAGIYCALPLTEFLPVATFLSAVGRFFEDPPAIADATEEGEKAEEVPSAYEGPSTPPS
jgi:hypothetical protein